MPVYTIEYIARKLKKMANRKTKRGKINDIIDLIFHPWFGKTRGIAEIADFLAHSANEKRLDLRKFAKYNLTTFIWSIAERRKKK